MAIYLGQDKVTLQGYISDEQEDSGAVKLFGYDGTVLYEYSKDEFLALSSLPTLSEVTSPLSYTPVVDISESLLVGSTDLNGKMYFNVWENLAYLTEDPVIEVDGVNWTNQYRSILNKFFDDAFNAAYDTTKQAYHDETDSFIINNETYKMVIDWPEWAGKNDVIGAVQFLKVNTKLIPQGWNWSLSDAKAYVQKFGYLDIGQMYITQSGDTEIDISFHSDCIRLSPILYLCVNGSANIDWGDNSTQSTVTGNSLTTRISNQHTYAQPGSYTIKIHVNSGSFAFYNYNATLFNSQVIVKNIRLGENCLINQDAFRNCYSLQSITLPNSITSIGTYAFRDCCSLKSITIPYGVTSISDDDFFDCYSLQSITIPNSVTSIRTYAFYGCSSLLSITIPDTVTSIDDYAFYTCRLIKKIGPKFSNINNRIIIDNLENLQNYIFAYCYSLKSITIPNGVTSISQDAFSDCYSLQSITIPNTVTSIGSNAFYNCYSLSSITLPDSVTSIGTYAFYNCCSLQSITIPDSVTTISSYAFEYCYSLKSITIPDSITSINNNAFYQCYSLQSITLPDTITSIKAYAFYNCRSLQSITILSGVTYIDTYAFDYCYSLQSVTIPDTVTTIGAYAFDYCSSLQSVTIPDSVTSIGNSAFRYCSCMKEYHLKPTTPPTLGTTAFTNIPSDCIIYVPQGSLSAYQSATNWSTYADYMQEENN